ncbi:hypothetical protein DFH07DRAFT_789254 [Mycena maculata]|uniref:Uncharacterized protein n=1 Tax=Mycena maculata TaxID=230809 RepID=A0AAD7KEE9_9AGAR|nr:hypothetical protein DFH07DRAFT_789254 [Mycena maculata]
MAPRPPSLSSSPDQYSDDRNLSSPSPSSPLFSFPRIQLSPNSPTLHEDDYKLSLPALLDTHEKVSYPLPSFRSLFPSDDDEHPLTSEYDASEYSEPDPTHDDTESEDEEQDPFFSDRRVTFFHTSAERLRPRRPLLRIAARTTSPAPSPVPSIVQRNISEPAPSTKNSPSDSSPDDEHDPSLPLPPPQASPVLSPISLSVSPMVGSVSPLSALEPLSPLSSPLSLPPSSLAGDHDMMDMDLESLPDPDEILRPIEAETGLGLFDAPPVPSIISSPHAAVPELLASIEHIEAVSMKSPAEDHVAHGNEMDVDRIVPKKRKKAVPKVDDPVAPTKSTDAKNTRGETAARSRKTLKAGEKQDTPQGDKGKKRSSQPVLREEGPKPKKARISDSSDAPGSRQLAPSRPKRVETKSTRAVETKEAQPKGKKATRDPPPPEPRAKQRKARPRSPSLSASSSSSVSPKRKPAPEIDPELCGMLIECMATSRASSLPMSTLYKTVMQSYPSLKSRGTDRECLEVMERVLESGTVAGGGTGIFGKVQSSTKDDSDPPLEAQWFYVPERDQDQDRAQLIRSMMPRPAKRAETKRYKQYYYRPLEKISRWDPEDEL